MAASELFLSLLLTVAARAVFAAEHVVGGDAGWSKATDYAGWVSHENFGVGDTLVFNYGNKDLVYEVSEDDYKRCGIGKPMNVKSGGQTVISLDKPGSRYFISPTFGHCAGGMKLAINVEDEDATKLAINVKDDAFPNLDDPVPNIPTGQCPGSGGGALSPPYPFIFGPTPPNPYPYPYGPGPYRSSSSSLPKMNLTLGFYCVLILVISFIA